MTPQHALLPAALRLLRGLQVVFLFAGDRARLSLSEMDLLRGAADAIGDAVGNVVSGGVLAVSAKLAEEEIKKNTGKDITVE